MFWCFTAGFDHMVNTYEAAVAWVNDTASAVVFTNAVAVVVRMSRSSNHRSATFVNRNSHVSRFSLWRKGNSTLARVTR